jgi:hypothetical protein
MLVALSVPSPAQAFPCGPSFRSVPRTAPVTPARRLQNAEAAEQVQTPDDCTTPSNRPRRAPAKANKKGSMSGLTVFVLAVAAALLIPIGRNGLPKAVDPYGHDRSFLEN